MKQPKVDKSLVINLDASKLPILREEGKNLVFELSAEDAIMKILEIEAKVQFAKDYIKKGIEAAGLAVNPNFKSVQGTRIKAGYQFFGAKYALDESHIEDLPVDLFEVVEIPAKKVIKLDSKAIDKWAAEHNGKLPLGVKAIDRVKQITLKPLEEFPDEG